MTDISSYPIIVIGAGAGGLVVAIGAAKANKKVLLIEKGNYGGDCTNFGCVPSKSLIAASHASHYLKDAANWGIKRNVSDLDARGALERTRSIVEEIRSHEDPKALEKMGVDTLTGTASFSGPHTLEVRLQNGNIRTIRGKNIIIATGSHPFIPSIEGLAGTPYLTNETIFDLKDIPKRLGVIGGGPIGSELAQAFQRLGSQVTIIQRGSHLLAKEELEAQQVIEGIFIKEGIQLMLSREPESVSYENGAFRLKILNQANQKKETLEVDQLLVSTGRRPTWEKLNLESIGVKTHKKGISVDKYGRTNLKHIWAVGDINGRALFTHVAENEARSVLTSLLLPWPFKSSLDKEQAIPRVTYTDPEIAAAGLTEEEAKTTFGEGKIAVYTVPFSEVDRAITTGRTEGFVKIITKKWSSRILGVTIAAPRAGEMLQ